MLNAFPKAVIAPKWRGPWLDFLKKRCMQRILVVTDTTGSFDPGSSVGLTELIRVLEGDAEIGLPMPVTVTKMSTASGFNFATATPAVNVANYDQVWLFGFQSGGAGLSVSERKVLMRFMQAGGGLFATGDHSTIGQPLCGGLPRVRKMREWAAVPMNGPNRIDTVNHPGADGIARSADQADAFPQTTYPLLRGVGAAAAPHPLLQSSHGPINVLPDHPHESECYAPRGAELDGNYDLPAEPGSAALSVIEFPTVAGVRHGPELVTIAMSASLNADKLPVVPRCFGAVSAYDGQLAGVGRVVCDATWHHFVNMNLNGAGYGGSGLREGTPLQPNAAYLQVQRYFANIADWLTPKNRRWCWIFDFIVSTVFRYPFLEEVPVIAPPRPLPPDPPWPLLLQVGQVVSEEATRLGGLGATQRLADDLFMAMELRVQNLLPLMPWIASLEQGKDTQAGLAAADSQELLLGLVGGVFLRTWDSLPADADKLMDSAERQHDLGAKPYREGLVRDLHTGLDALRSRHESQAKAIARFDKLKI